MPDQSCDMSAATDNSCTSGTRAIPTFDRIFVVVVVEMNRGDIVFVAGMSGCESSTN